MFRLSWRHIVHVVDSAVDRFRIAVWMPKPKRSTNR